MVAQVWAIATWICLSWIPRSVVVSTLYRLFIILKLIYYKAENEPLIPTLTRFLFTTDSSYSGDQEEESSQANIQLNTVAFDRYFEKPEVLQAFREQAIIETPVFESIAELSSVGGRFRPRGAEDVSSGLLITCSIYAYNL